MITDEAAPEARERGGLYAALALAFYPPGPAAESVLRSIEDAAVLASVGASVNDRLPASLPVDNPLQLEQEYNRLFVGPGHVLCPPYESVHTTGGGGGERGLVLGLSAQAVQSAYNEAGLALVEGFTDLPDHVAVELEFMKYLCDREAEAPEQERSGWQLRESKFIREHIALWLPAFADSVVKNTASPYYRAAATLLKEFVAQELENLPTGGGD